MGRTWNGWSRKLHRYGSIVTLLPLLVIIPSGLLLQLKKESDWIQPPTQRGAAGPPSVRFDQILAAARSVPAAEVETWDDIDRLDVRPGDGIVKVQARSSIEIQVDLRTGAVLQAAVRRSDLIESIHDGSFFHPKAKLWIFLPTAAILLALWFTGAWLWILPHWNRFKARRR